MNIYVHEYIHYRQAGCNDDFLGRFGWGWKEGAPSGAVAYMDITHCSGTERVNEFEPLIFNFIFSITYVTLATRFVLQKFFPVSTNHHIDIGEEILHEEF